MSGTTKKRISKPDTISEKKPSTSSVVDDTKSGVKADTHVKKCETNEKRDKIVDVSQP